LEPEVLLELVLVLGPGARTATAECSVEPELVRLMELEGAPELPLEVLRTSSTL
jgi:hypothetical protein